MYKKYIKNTFFVFVIIIFGKCLSFLRDLTISLKFGSTLQTDAYFIAGNVPSIIFTAILSSYLILVIPTYKSISIKKGKYHVNIFTSKLINYFIIISTLLSIIGFFTANYIISLLAPGFNQDTHNFSVHICKILILSFPLSSITLILANISNANEKYYALHLIPIFSSIFVIIPLFIFSNKYGIELVAISSVAAFIFQLFIQILISKNDFKYTFNVKPFDENIKNMTLLMFPLFISYSIDQLNILVTSSMCTYLSVGSLSSYNYAIRLQSVINGSISISIISVIYPLLSKYYAENKYSDFNLLLLKSIRITITILSPIVLILSFFSKEIVTLVFFRGNFDVNALNNTSIAFKYSILNVLILSIRDILLRAYYISKNTNTPLYSSLLSLIFNIILSFLLINKFKLEGIVFANLISLIISLIIIIIHPNKSKYLFYFKIDNKFILQTSISTFIVFTFLLILKHVNINFSIVNIIVFSIISLIIYLFCLTVLNHKEGVLAYNHLKKLFHDRL